MFDPATIGTPYDEPATAASLATGQPGTTLFALLKGILLMLTALADGPQEAEG